MKQQEYHKYLLSLDWLLKKNELISVFLKEGWHIECFVCGKTDKLQVHHMNYKNVGKEILIDERIHDLRFCCADCHKKWHKEKGFKEKWEREMIEQFFNTKENGK